MFETPAICVSQVTIFLGSQADTSRSDFDDPRRRGGRRKSSTEPETTSGQVNILQNKGEAHRTTNGVLGRHQIQGELIAASRQHHPLLVAYGSVSCSNSQLHWYPKSALILGLEANPFRVFIN